MTSHDLSASGPVLLVGAGRLGSALLRGWQAAGAIEPAELLILEPNPGVHAIAVSDRGAHLDPADAQVRAARIVVLALKPQVWREAVGRLAELVAPDAVIVSVMAGVGLRELGEVFGGRPLARAMPTTAIAVRQGVAAIYADAEAGRRAAHVVLDPVATTVDLAEEAQIDAAIGISGSAPGFLYAFVEALEAAGEAQGLPVEASRVLARSAIAGAAALMAESGEAPGTLRAEVTSPGGTTEAGLRVLGEGDALSELVGGAVAAAADRARELGGAAQSTKARSST